MERLTIQVLLTTSEGTAPPNFEEEVANGAGARVQKSLAISDSDPEKIGKKILPILAEIEKFVVGDVAP